MPPGHRPVAVVLVGSFPIYAALLSDMVEKPWLPIPRPQSPKPFIGRHYCEMNGNHALKTALSY